jgi:hypothetical protein
LQSLTENCLFVEISICSALVTKDESLDQFAIACTGMLAESVPRAVARDPM